MKPFSSVSSRRPERGVLGVKDGVVGSFRVMPLGVRVKVWGARLMIWPLEKGKKWAEAMLAPVRPVRVRVPSGAMVVG
jgi:hypothetical protein